VKILVGPATGRLGLVVIDRNGNYIDYEPYSAADSIGVQVVEPMQIAPELRELLISDRFIANDEDSLRETAVRWFDSPEQLELVMSSSAAESSESQ
jgi:hypothetical protein